MAYLDRTDPRRRATAMIGVGAVHAALAAALIAGLTVTGLREHKPHIIGVPIAPPPPPTPPKQAKHDPVRDTSRVVAPLPPLDIPLPRPTAAPLDPVIDRFVDPIPLPTPTHAIQPMPTPSFTPKGASPIGSPGRWITTDDYPAGPLRRGDEGLARYRLVITSAGKVSACEITATSGSSDLDRETCRLLSKRAQFAPATDQSGAKVVGTFSGSVRWDIPD